MVEMLPLRSSQPRSGIAARPGDGLSPHIDVSSSGFQGGAGPSTHPQSPPEHLFDLVQEALLAEQTIVRRSALKTSHDVPTKVCEENRISFP